MIRTAIVYAIAIIPFTLIGLSVILAAVNKLFG